MCDDLNNDGMYDDREPTEEEYQKELKRYKEEYEPYWENVIAIFAGS